ncbi:hypothetical protein [Rhodopirellula sallentina]|uniref:Secreted protein n=1 Tax=Rhodopirellula sallentina SM41 TaxID=1263870 RepID=M5U6Z6_9BACT|nr:hypothetical protein [Rhodopirellula sallentina]EMI51708.1 secreted protein [Rhodopirellula sallentina SM41]
MKLIAHLALALLVSAPLACTVGCGDSNQPVDVLQGQSREDLDAQADAISAEFERSGEESDTPGPTAEEEAMNRS